MPEAPLTPNEISEQELNAGYWFVTHKPQLRKALIVLLIAVDAALIGFSGYKLTLDILDIPAREQMMAELATSQINPELRKANAPKALMVSNVQTLAPSDRYDFIATLKNPNAALVAHFSYRFAAAGFATPLAKGFALPNEEKFVTALGVGSETRPAGTQLEISDLTWQRIDRHVIPDWERFVREHLTLPVTDILFTPAIEISTGKNIGKTAFTITNRTGYGYYEVPIIVIMYRGSAIVGVNSTTIANLKAGETRMGEVNWYVDMSGVSTIKVIPQIDITDDSVYSRAN